MFGNLFSGWHIVILIALVVLLFGATKLPALAKSIGESVRILRKETKPTRSDVDADSGADAEGEAAVQSHGDGPKADESNADGPNPDRPNPGGPVGAPSTEPPRANPPQRD